MSSSDSSSSSESEDQTKVVKPQEDDGSLLEIDLKKPEPLSKKQKRLLKKGKINEDKTGEVKASKKARKEHASRDDLDGKADSSDDEKEGEDNDDEKKAKSKKSEFSVWIGNLSFDTTVDDIKRFIVAKTANNDKKEDSELVTVTEKDITRVKLPLAPAHRAGPRNSKSGGGKRICGFAYVDLKTQEQVNTVVALSEEYLNGRNLLIKDAKSFEGRPAVVTTTGKVAGAALSKNPPSRILFVGNLAFDTTETALEEHFQHCGDITKIRMATFEDSGNCKGFAFVDFMDVEGSTNALKDKSCRKLGGRFLRMEFGEDRSQRTKQDKSKSLGSHHRQSYDESAQNQDKSSAPSNHNDSAPADTYQDRPKRKHDNYNNNKKSQSFGPNKRLKPGLALATAQRAKTSILPSSGKKITFD